MLKAVLAAGLAAAPLAGAGAVRAQAVEEATSFAVPAGPLSSALVAFGRQSGLQVSYAPEIATGKASRGVAGPLSPDGALERLLAGTGLLWRWANDTTITVYDPTSAAMTANAQGTVPLDEIQVTGTGTKSGETAWGPVEGYVATRSAAGSKSDTPIVEVPQSVSVVTRDQMRDRAVQTVTEALQYTPGVLTMAGGKDPRFDVIYLRGFNTQGSGGYRDGMREFADANYFSSWRTEPYGLERIDVMRGPGSVLYGQTGPGGVIDKISKRPTVERFAEIVGTFGNFDLFQGAFDVGGAADPEGKYQFRLTGLARDSDAQIAHFSQFVPDDRLYVAPAFTWQPTADTKWTLLTEYQHDKIGNAFPVSRLRTSGTTVTAVTALPLYLGDPNWNKFDQEQYRVASLFEHRFNDVLTVKQNMAFTSITLDYRYLTGAVYNNGTTAARVARQSEDKADTYTLDNQAHVKFATGPVSHAVLVGFDYQMLGLDTVFKGGGSYPLNVADPVYGIAVQPVTTVLTSTDQNLRQAGLYAQDQIRLDKWLLTLGVRHDSAELESANRVTNATTTASDTATTKRVGLTYLFDNGVAPYASWATSFLPTTGTDYSGDPFKPTTGRQYEIGVKWQPPGSRTLVTFAAFDIVQQNVLTADPVHTNYNVQTGEVSSRGLEFQATTTPLAGFDVVLSASIQDVEVTGSNKAGELGNVPVLIPEQQAAAWAKYTIQSGVLAGLGVGAGVRYVGPTWADYTNTIRNDAQTVVDAALSYDWKGARFALNVTNLFDREQAICTTSGGCQWISPRTVVGSVRYRW
ncbi:TonB-dependent siderophore receptor [Rhodoplanes sp. TEM]|uniref:TonB-dependent siderophore receptor n=1 Tax=Rhodoplanes tepidamans TaxID=200616 RepID=A0ABT5JDJ7_RHOTP|nr:MULTISPECIES: TonB-dependent siderophore receptor [Rhodoplanes]MDC7787771.1 TonB-dependent siderophore receptor [Rhodoplanes tepidamans]MDC7982666.1 TonB-dependent siderophore receptor [Rhodoplanes sp. TEM]MDQ0357687.1 iron complex outermembrane receptor protein [Rhodoplanes tepidamans]